MRFQGHQAGGGPLQGVRIVEMGQLIAIPFAMKLLGDMGAQVIRLESTRRLESYRSDSVYQNEVHGEFWNRGANFYEQNRNKLGITLDLGRPEGLEVLRRLISVSTTPTCIATVWGLVGMSCWLCGRKE